MAFRVRITPAADRDLKEILAWLIAEGAGDAGLRWFRGLREAIDTLTDSPRRCALSPENGSVPFEMRQLLYGSSRHRYRILFMIEDDTVFILRIRRPGQEHLSTH
jgi:plasmid stabilization system protein ParE